MHIQNPKQSQSTITKNPNEAIPNFVLRCLGPLLQDDFPQMKRDLQSVYFERAERQYQEQLCSRFLDGDNSVTKLESESEFEASDSAVIRAEGQRELVEYIDSLPQEELVSIVSELREADRKRIVFELELRVNMLGSFLPLEKLRPKFGVQGEFWVEGPFGERKVCFGKEISL